MNETQYNALKQAVADRAHALRERVSLARRMKAEDKALQWETENIQLHEAFAIIKAEYKP